MERSLPIWGIGLGQSEGRAGVCSARPGCSIRAGTSWVRGPAPMRPADRVRGIVRSCPYCEVYPRPPGSYMIAPLPTPRNKRNIQTRTS